MRYFPLFISAFILSVFACQPSIPIDEDSTYESISSLPPGLASYAKTFINLYNPSKEKDSFVFFTDPHLLGSNFIINEHGATVIIDKFESVKALYDVLPLSFCLCGGDWLNSGDTQEEAIAKLSFADRQMNGLFSHYYKMLGNHDTNYQGVVSYDNLDRGDLPIDYINNSYFKSTGRSYYSFKSNQTVFYIMDSGTDWEPSMNDYRVLQLKWLAESLLVNAEHHIVIGIHILINSSPKENAPTPFAMNMLALCQAFNERESFEVEGRQYDFSNVVGKIHVVLAGHNHEDYIRTSYGIPCVGVTQFMKNGNPTFDLCLLDYDNGYLEMIRVGEGESRRIKLMI